MPDQGPGVRLTLQQRAALERILAANGPVRVASNTARSLVVRGLVIPGAAPSVTEAGLRALDSGRSVRVRRLSGVCWAEVEPGVWGVFGPDGLHTVGRRFAGGWELRMAPGVVVVPFPDVRGVAGAVSRGSEELARRGGRWFPHAVRPCQLNVTAGSGTNAN